MKYVKRITPEAEQLIIQDLTKTLESMAALAVKHNLSLYKIYKINKAFNIRTGKSKSYHIPGLSGENHPRHKLTLEQVIKIRKLWSKGRSQNKIAKLYKVNQSTINRIVRGVNWRV